MSLNGLDDPKIKEAHDTAVAEPGGWFLLKYAARDEVELLGRGNGGIVDIRNAIAKYEEPSPLFGFLRYRRRNVIIKYVPEECSRLVQARVTVHFNAVTERFSPHDTEFSIASAKELRDTTLSAACSLHTASGSTSSSTSSLRRRRLMEIAEDEEEDLRAKRQSTVPEERPSTGKALSPSASPPTLASPDLPIGSDPTISYLSSPEYDSFPPPREPYSPTKSIGEGRKSSQSARPELYSSASYGSGKPKVKLGPRPSLDVGGRPHTSGAVSYFRPVSTLPAGLKVSQRTGSKKEKDRPQSLFPLENPSMTISPPPLPDTLLMPSQDGLVRPHTSGGRPLSSQSMKPLASPTTSIFPKTPTITPEKSRLLKAMELRKKQMSAKRASGLQLPGVSVEEPDEMASEAQENSSNPDEKADDSGIAFDSNSTAKTDDSDATRSDSYPVSPVGPSEVAESTKASSISDSTDETVQETRTSATNESFENHTSRKEDAARPETNNAIADTVEIVAENTNSISSDKKRESLQKLFPTVYNPFQIPTEAKELPVVLDIPAVIVEEEVSEQTSHASEADEVTQFPAEETSEIPKPHYTAVSQDASKPSPSSVVNEEANAVSAISSISGQELQSLPEIADEPEETSLTEGVTSSMGILPPLITSIENPARESHSEVRVEPTSPSKSWKVPRSKFSVQDLRAKAAIPTTPTEPVPRAALTLPPEKSPVESTFSIETKRSMTEDERGAATTSSKRRKRRGLVDPIKTDVDAANRSGGDSEANFSSDDDLMDELQSAVFQDAQPISVSKSPISPVFPSPQKRTSETSRFSRAFSGPMGKDASDSHMLEPPSSSSSKQPAPRSVSAGAAYLNRINQQAPKPLPKKVNLGSGISQRIKALEKLSSLAPNASPGGTTAPNVVASTSFFSVRKSNTRSSSQSPSVAERAGSLTQHTPSPTSSPETLKLRDRSGSMKNRLDAFASSPVSTSQPGRSRPESVSVTARIIRDPSQPFPIMPQIGKDPTDYAPLDLKQSPLVIDHQKAIIEPLKETIQERRQSRERRLSNASKATMHERRSSITVIKDLISDGRASFSERRRSVHLDPGVTASSVLSPARPPSVHQSPGRRPSSVSSRRNSRDLAAGFSPPPTAGSMSSTSDDRSEKKTTRASRMLRRMSSSLSASRKTITHAMSPTVREESEPVPGLDFLPSTSSQPSNVPAMPTNISVGDVNVQFPDSLLWKRRSMLLDSAGYLILSPALTAHGTGKQASVGATRKFHMGEFRTPAIPDMEMEELPNSVTLDFIEGGGLQVACEDRAGQGRVLKILQETHRVWAAYGQ